MFVRSAGESKTQAEADQAEAGEFLQHAADQLSAEVQRRAMHLATVLEPLLIVGMGLVVMLIVLAVLMPIIQLNQLVR